MKTHVLAALLPLLSSTLGCSALVDLDGLTEGGPSPPDGMPDGKTFEFVDDAFFGEFERGAYQDTEWAGDRLRLKVTALGGTFRSQVFDAGEAVDWTSLSWTPAQPYLKALPDANGQEEGYASGAADMTANVLLLHLDGMGLLLSGTATLDDSGLGSQAFLNGAPGVDLDFQEGPIGQGLADRIDTHLGINADGGQFEFNKGDFTWALWVNTASTCLNNKVFLGADTSVVGPHLWLGCAPGAVFGACGPGSPQGRAAGAIKSNQDDSTDGVQLCGTSQINDGRWHHLAVVKKGHAQSQVVLYVDGIAETTQDTTLNNPISLKGGELTVGAMLNGAFQSEGSFDEVAVWKRALGPDEVASIYRRGGARLALRVRACNDAACAENDPPFVGPAGAAWFVDPIGTLGPPTNLTIDLPRARYFQYEASFESYREGDGPALLAVKIQAQR